MKLMQNLALALLACVALFGRAALADNDDPLFVNMTTDEPHRAAMALAFSKNQLERGHPLTIFLNDKGVLVGSKINADKYKEQQTTLAELLKKGAAVLICPMCMKHYGVNESDLVDGVKVGNPDLTGAALFKNDTKALTW